MIKTLAGKVLTPERIGAAMWKVGPIRDRLQAAGINLEIGVARDMIRASERAIEAIKK